MAIGYACLTIGVPGTDLSRCILRNASEENLKRITEKNLSALEAMLHYNIENNIKLFRISSDIIPFGSHPVNQLPWWELYEKKLLELGHKIAKAGIRVSMHPGQYTVLNSPNYTVVENAINDLEYHNRFLSSLDAGKECKLILHVGGVYGDKAKAMDAFLLHYHKLKDGVRRRLVIENDDRNYNIEDVLQISAKTGAPVVFDNLHHLINPPDFIMSDAEWIKVCGNTWTKEDGVQKIHYSQQKETGRPGSHSDTINIKDFAKYYSQLPYKNLDIMLEVKDKNISAVKCNKAIYHKDEI